MIRAAGKCIAIIGAGPAGLMAAEVLAQAGCRVDIFERMPSPARKFLMAGRGGLNITHGEELDRFQSRYGAQRSVLEAAIRDFTPGDMQRWCRGLGIETFTGSSGRIFPKGMKASPLLRAWLRKLDALGVRLHVRRNFCGWTEDGAPIFETGNGGREHLHADAVILALGGASWPRLGGDGSWRSLLEGRRISVEKFRPSNCGFETRWSEYFSARFSGAPLKNIAIHGADHVQRGECVIADYGLEGGAIYALSVALRDEIQSRGGAIITIDLKPDVDLAGLAERLLRPRGKQSMSAFLRKTAGLDAPAIALLREQGELPGDAQSLAQRIKEHKVELLRARPLDRAISSAGGVKFDELNAHFMLWKMPGVFAAGEMLDWEAPTGGYLLQACFATGRAAALGALRWIEASN